MYALSLFPSVSLPQCKGERKDCSEAGETEEETGKLYYFNKYLKGQTLTLEQGSKGWRARAAGPVPSLRC
jgi:hypothetical protein